MNEASSKKRKKTPRKDWTLTGAKKAQIVYPIVNVLPYFDKRYNPKALGSLTAEKAMEHLGWRIESENLKFKGGYLFLDRNGAKVRCNNNLHNRPFDKRLAEDYMLEILRGKWKLNGESCIIDDTAMVQDSQHRMVALVWAAQEWKKHPDKWAEYWNTEPVMDTIVVTGVPHDDDTINTINTGKRRSLSDVIYRSGYFRDLNQQMRRRVAKTTEWTIKLLWFRTGQMELSNAPRMPHSEAIDFLERHIKILEAVRYILDKDGKNKAIGGYVPVGYATAMLYLMGVSNSDREEYEQADSEKGMDFDCWQDALDFWELIATKSTGVEALLDTLLDIPEDVGGGYIRQLRCGLLCKAWNLYIKSKDVTKAGLKLRKGKNEGGHPVILETPTCGGIDIGGKPAGEEE